MFFINRKRKSVIYKVSWIKEEETSIKSLIKNQKFSIDNKKGERELYLLNTQPNFGIQLGQNDSIELIHRLDVKEICIDEGINVQFEKWVQYDLGIIKEQAPQKIENLLIEENFHRTFAKEKVNVNLIKFKFNKISYWSLSIETNQIYNELKAQKVIKGVFKNNFKDFFDANLKDIPSIGLPQWIEGQNKENSHTIELIQNALYNETVTHQSEYFINHTSKWGFHLDKNILYILAGNGKVEYFDKTGRLTSHIISKGDQIKIPPCTLYHFSTNKGLFYSSNPQNKQYKVNLYNEVIRLDYEKKTRYYDSTLYPTFLKTSEEESSLHKLSILYKEVQSNYRHLADIRFKLLGFVPAVSVIAWATLLKNLLSSELSDYSQNVFGAIISLLGLGIVYGIRTYDKRNDDLYNDLISRGRKIEKELGIHTGIFLGRKTGYRKDFLGLTINHSNGLNLIYGAVFLGWCCLLSWFIYNVFFKNISFPFDCF